MIASAAAYSRPYVLGIVGCPGAGKSYAAGKVAAELTARGLAATVLPMDGFHLSRYQLARLGLLDRKGAPESFDVLGFMALLARLREPMVAGPVYAPDYDREVHEPIAGRISFDGATRVVVVEGNYLLLQRPPWSGVGELLDATWFLECAESVRTDRLIERQVAGGKSPQDARHWVDTVDRANAELIEAEGSGAGFRSDSTLLDAQLLGDVGEPGSTAEVLDRHA